MKVLGFVGSPRKDGNTSFLVNKMLEGSKEKGAETKTINLTALNIKPCQSCYGCKGGSNECIIKDDMQNLYKEINESDGFILGSPVYMWQMNAQSKIFTDRLFAFFGSKAAANKKNVILAYTHGNPDSDMFKTYFDYTKNMFEFLGYNVLDLYAVGDTQNKPVESRKELFSAMKELGAKF